MLSGLQSQLFGGHVLIRYHLASILLLITKLFVMQVKDVYTLVKKDVPEILDGQIVSDPDVGGVKLVYWKRRVILHSVNIGSIKISYPVKFLKIQRIVFLRPYKKHWDSQRNRLDRNYWGKTNHPLTRMWIVIETDYKKWSDTTVRFKDQVTDHEFIKAFKSEAETFSIYVNQK